MVVPFGFSVGDCIAVSLLIKDAVVALDSAHGAAAEYQEIIRELWTLDRALLEVTSVSQGFETTIELNALGHAARRAADQCRTCIVNFLDKVKGYRKALGSAEGSGSRWKDARGKIGWALFKGDEVKAFRTEICAHSQALNMLLTIANVSLTKLNDKNLRERLEDARRTQDENTEEQLVAIRQINVAILEHSSSLQTQEDTLTRLADGMKYILTLGSELKTFMTRIVTMSFRSYSILVDLQTRVPREFGPCWIQEPLILTDALGRVTPIHLELINSWDVLDSVLTARFRDVPGEKKIKQKEYVLQNQRSLLDIDRSVSFQVSFLPGQKFDMSMVFKEEIDIDARSCPGCGTRPRQYRQSATTCLNCGLCFQRVEEIIDHDELPAMNSSLTATGKPAGDIDMESGPIDSRKKRGSDTEIEDRMSLFKRVRILYTSRTREHRRGGARNRASSQDRRRTYREDSRSRSRDRRTASPVADWNISVDDILMTFDFGVFSAEALVQTIEYINTHDPPRDWFPGDYTSMPLERTSKRTLERILERAQELWYPRTRLTSSHGGFL